MRSRSKDTSQLGFALVELLVVLTVFGLLTSLATLSLRSASNGWDRISRTDANSEELQSVSHLLRRLISQARPDMIGNGSSAAVRFTGEPKRLEFLAPLSERFGAEDIVLYDLRLSEDGKLHIAWRLDRPPGETESGVDEVIDGISDASFSYYDEAGVDLASLWLESWMNRKSLPQLVRVHFIWHDHAVNIIIAPKVTSTLCQMATSEADCPK